MHSKKWTQCVTSQFWQTCPVILFFPPWVQHLFFYLTHYLSIKPAPLVFGRSLPNETDHSVEYCFPDFSSVAISKNRAHLLWAWKWKIISRLLGWMVVIASWVWARNWELSFGYFELKIIIRHSSEYLRKQLNRGVAERGSERNHGCRQNLGALSI